jgi:hypothetical protein
MLVLSEDERVAAETSPPPQVDPEATTPVPIPRAPKLKKARIGVAGKQELATGSMSIPLLEDVSFLFLVVAFCLFDSKDFVLVTYTFFVSTLMQHLMKKLADLGSHFIGFRDEAITLKGEALTLSFMCSCLVFAPSLTFSFQRRYVMLKNALTT